MRDVFFACCPALAGLAVVLGCAGSGAPAASPRVVPATYHQADTPDAADTADAAVPPRPGAESLSEALAGDVVLRDHAWLHAGLESPIRFRIDASPSPHGDRDVTRFRVVADHGPWVEVTIGDSAGWPPRTCIVSLPRLRLYGLRLFVRRAALVPITVRAVQAEFEDGTRIGLRPGVPVGAARAGDGWRLIDTVYGRFFVPVPQDAIGYAFEDWGPAPSAPFKLEQPLAREALLEYANGEYIAMGGQSFPYHTVGIRVAPENQSLFPEVFVDVDTECFSATLRTWEHNVLEVEEVAPFGTIGTAIPGNRIWHSANAGTEVLWSDGSRAGTLQDDLEASTIFHNHQGLKCTSLIIGAGGPSEERTVVLCFHPSSLHPFTRGGFSPDIAHVPESPAEDPGS